MKPRDDIRLFMGMPSRDGRIDYRVIEQWHRMKRQVQKIAASINCCSLLAFNFNKILASALTYRDKPPEGWGGGATHLLLWHDDILPIGDTWFLDLLGEMEKHELKAISAVVSMRDNEGWTSTAYDPPGENPDPIRYKVGEINGTITSRDGLLLINTGLLLMDLRDPWINDFCFRINDGIRHEKDGTHYAICCSEDFFMSRIMRLSGIPFGATTVVKNVHLGSWGFPNFVEPVAASTT